MPAVMEVAVDSENRVCLLNVGRLVASALIPALTAHGIVSVESIELLVGRPYVRVVTITAGTWHELSTNDPMCIGSVALLETPTLDDARRAFSFGAAIISNDFDPDLAADVIAARSLGDVRVPAPLIAGLMGTRVNSLSTSEERILSLRLRGQTAREIASNTHYSERHVRRVLHAILTKAGTRDVEAAANHFGVQHEGES
jgi:hypothetical protein